MLPLRIPSRAFQKLLRDGEVLVLLPSRHRDGVVEVYSSSRSKRVRAKIAFLGKLQKLSVYVREYENGAKYCPSCKRRYFTEGDYCPRCGSPLRPRPRRKIKKYVLINMRAEDGGFESEGQLLAAYHGSEYIHLLELSEQHV